MILIFTIDKDKKDSLILVACPPRLIRKGLDIINSLNYKYKTNMVLVSNCKSGYLDNYFKGCFTYLGLLGTKGKFSPPQPPKLRLPSVQYYDKDIDKKIYEILQHMHPDKTVEPLNIFDIKNQVTLREPGKKTDLTSSHNDSVCHKSDKQKQVVLEVF